MKFSRSLNTFIRFIAIAAFLLFILFMAVLFAAPELISQLLSCSIAAYSFLIGVTGLVLVAISLTGSPDRISERMDRRKLH